MKTSMSRSRKIEEWIRTLVLKFNYLPLAYEYHLTALLEQHKPILYEDIEHIKKKAVEILVTDTEETELYRQAIYHTLARQGIAFQQDIYVLGKIASKVLRGKNTLESELALIRKSIEEKNFRRSEYKLASRLVADLVVLNFGYVIPDYTHDFIFSKRSLSNIIKPIGATIQSLALSEKLPIYTVRDGLLDQSDAEELVEFAIGIRQYAVSILLEKHPTKFSDYYALLRTYIKNEIEKRMRIRGVERFATLEALVESTMVPYYLYRYGFLKIDIASLMFFEIKYI